jgi:hypothetical protein
MIKIVKAVSTCGACPSQWDAWTDDGKYVYIRYRWGHLSISYEVLGEPILEKNIGDEYGGVMSFEELVEHTKGVIEWDASLNSGTIEEDVKIYAIPLR